jgi:uncharacterized protein YjbJ (UPF0337 family)
MPRNLFSPLKGTERIVEVLDRVIHSIQPPAQKLCVTGIQERGRMNKQTIKGAVDQTVGSAKRHIGNVTGDTGTQMEGGVQQIKGKVETAVGKLKDASHTAQHNPQASPESNQEG